MGKGYSLNKEGADYYFEIMTHIRSMSDGLKNGIDVGQPNTESLVGYYRQIIHLEGLLVPWLDKTFYNKREKIVESLPSYSSTWGGDFTKQMNYFMSISDLFQLLILTAYNSGVLKLKMKMKFDTDDDVL